LRRQEVYEALHKVPFQPFRIQLSNGQSHVIHHPDFAWLTRTSVLIGLSSGDDDIPDGFAQCDLLHVVAIEPADGIRGPGSSRRRKRSS
jgi:hypothetical protein